MGRYDRVDGRDGTASLSPAFGPLAGRRHVAVAEGRQRGDRARFVAALPEGRHAGVERLVPVMDRPDARSPASPHEVFPPGRAERPADRPEVRRTPGHGSRLDMAGIESGALARGLPGRVGDRPALGRHATARDRHGAGVAADRRLATADARTRLRKLHPAIDA